VRGGAVSRYCKERKRVICDAEKLACDFTDALFLVQLGPVANVLIYYMVLANANNTYVDMGHSLDPILFDDPSREFHTSCAADMCKNMNVGWKP
jgi:hypothetical protein